MYRNSVGQPGTKKPFPKHRYKVGDNIKMYFREIG
jgi:hypothetical protein